MLGLSLRAAVFKSTDTHMRNVCNFIPNGFSYFPHGRIPHFVSTSPFISLYSTTSVFDTPTASLPNKAKRPCQRPSKLLGWERQKYHEIVQLVVPCIALVSLISPSLVGLFRRATRVARGVHLSFIRASIGSKSVMLAKYSPLAWS